MSVSFAEIHIFYIQILFTIRCEALRAVFSDECFWYRSIKACVGVFDAVQPVRLNAVSEGIKRIEVQSDKGAPGFVVMRCFYESVINLVLQQVVQKRGDFLAEFRAESSRPIQRPKELLIVASFYRGVVREYGEASIILVEFEGKRVRPGSRSLAPVLSGT